MAGLCEGGNEPPSSLKARKWLKHTFGLMFLFPHEVESCFTEDFMSDKPVDEQIDAYSDYLLEIYITPEAPFPPEIWACHSASNELTTNACESFHASYNKSFYQEHLNLPDVVAMDATFSSHADVRRCGGEKQRHALMRLSPANSWNLTRQLSRDIKSLIA
ncbi:hypothetical protein ANN_10069 [Periplaneta americana]|uniref:Uncharacterized protein n=1 Tax=Periplaneta americana TaxID=6978 RepID=A0ABQ8TPU8_PERAM|nr:hypothetical protein ANN_10069 [Periplaneta americana]